MNKLKTQIGAGFVFLVAAYSPIVLSKNLNPLSGTQLALYVKVYMSGDKCQEPKACQIRPNYCCNEAVEDCD